MNNSKEISKIFNIVLTKGIETSKSDILGEDIDDKAPVYIMKTDVAGDLTGEVLTGYAVSANGGSGTGSTDKQKLTKESATTTDKGQSVMVDYYVIKNEANVYELQIDAENFAGYYYVEADTLFRRQIDGKDLPANLTFPNVKIQSNFTFSMASSGDPSTFTFTMDAFPGYTYFD
jgi:hypothetical protein